MIVGARRCCRDQTAPGFFGEKGWEERARDCLEDTQLRLATIFGMLTTLLEPYACRHLHAGWGMLTTTDGLTSLLPAKFYGTCALLPNAASYQEQLALSYEGSFGRLGGTSVRRKDPTAGRTFWRKLRIYREFTPSVLMMPVDRFRCGEGQSWEANIVQAITSAGYSAHAVVGFAIWLRYARRVTKAGMLELFQKSLERQRKLDMLRVLRDFDTSGLALYEEV